MAQAKKGDKVKINYTGTLEAGTVFDSTIESECDTDGCSSDDCGTDDCGCSSDDCGTDDCGCNHESGPMELTIGSEEFFPQIEEALIGMTPGEKKTVMVPASSAFGEYDEEKVFTVPRADVPEDLKPEVGDELTVGNEDDEEMEVTVVEVSDESITFDSNHPLAGEDLTFAIELLEIV